MLLLLDGLKVGRAVRTTVCASIDGLEVGSTVGAAVDGLEVGSTVGAAVDGLEVGTTVNCKTPTSLVLAALIDSMLCVSFSPA
jgi:hypothetical protein